LKFSDIEDICKTYGYRFGDLVYYNVRGYPLEEGLRLMSSNHNVDEMVAAYVGHDLIVLYMVMYGVGDDEEDSEYEKAAVYRNDAFWDSVLSDDTDCLDSDDDGDIDERVGNDERDDTDEHVRNDKDGDGDKDRDGNGDGNEDGDGDDAINVGKGDADGNVGQHRSGEHIKENDSIEYKDDNDELRLPFDSGEDSAGHPHKDVTKRVPFDFTDINNPTLIKGNTFYNAPDFRKVVKQYNIIRGKDLRFKKNELKRIAVVCKESRCKYRVYGR
jgi:hypothetical protein